MSHQVMRTRVELNRLNQKLHELQAIESKCINQNDPNRAQYLQSYYEKQRKSVDLDSNIQLMTGLKEQINSLLTSEFSKVEAKQQSATLQKEQKEPQKKILNNGKTAVIKQYHQVVEKQNGDGPTKFTQEWQDPERGRNCAWNTNTNSKPHRVSVSLKDQPSKTKEKQISELEQHIQECIQRRLQHHISQMSSKNNAEKSEQLSTVLSKLETLTTHFQGLNSSQKQLKSDMDNTKKYLTTKIQSLEKTCNVQIEHSANILKDHLEIIEFKLRKEIENEVNLNQEKIDKIELKFKREINQINQIQQMQEQQLEEACKKRHLKCSEIQRAEPDKINFQSLNLTKQIQQFEQEIIGIKEVVNQHRQNLTQILEFHRSTAQKQVSFEEQISLNINQIRDNNFSRCSNSELAVDKLIADLSGLRGELYGLSMFVHTEQGKIQGEVTAQKKASQRIFQRLEILEKELKSVPINQFSEQRMQECNFSRVSPMFPKVSNWNQSPQSFLSNSRVSYTSTMSCAILDELSSNAFVYDAYK